MMRNRLSGQNKLRPVPLKQATGGPQNETKLAVNYIHLSALAFMIEPNNRVARVCLKYNRRGLARTLERESRRPPLPLPSPSERASH